MNEPRFLGFTPDGRARYACDYEAEMLRPVAGGADPESNDQIDASADDAYERELTGVMNLTGATVWAEDNTASSARYWGGLRFHNGPFPAKGSTVDVARISVYIGSTGADDANLDIHAEDGASPATFTSAGFNITGRARTAASAAWVANSIGTGWHDSPSIVSVIQELVTDYDPTAIVVILKPKGTAAKMLDFQAWDCGDPTVAAKLHLEWTVGGGAAEVLAVTAAATAEGLVPAITATKNISITAVVAEATAEGLQAVISIGGSVEIVAVAAEADAVGLAPTITAIQNAIISAVVAEADATALVPTVAAIKTVTITAVIATATAEALVPSVHTGVTILAVVAEADADANAATITVIRNITVVAVVAQADAVGLPPTILTGIVYAEFGKIIASINPADYPTGITLKLLVVIWTDDAGKPVHARLYNVTDGDIVASSDVETASTVPAEIVSAALSLAAGNKTYRVEIGGLPGGTYHCAKAVVRGTI